jgi:hypothetical protein
MQRGTLSWRRVGALALAVLALHALLLRGVHDVLAARARGAPTRPSTVLQVRTLVQAAAVHAEAAIVALTPTDLPPRPALPVFPVEPALAQRSATSRAGAPRVAGSDDLPPPAAVTPARTPTPESNAPAPGATTAAAPALAGAAPATASGDLPI